MLADLVASLTKASFTEKLEILDAIDLMERFKKALPLLVRQVKSKFSVLCTFAVKKDGIIW